MNSKPIPVSLLLFKLAIISSCGTKRIAQPEKLANSISKVNNSQSIITENKKNTDSLTDNKPAAIIDAELISKYKDTLSNTTAVVLKNGVATEWLSSQNYNLRKPNFVIIHHTAQDSLAQTIKTFQLARTNVSSHYIIGEDGRVIQMVNDYLRAWHGGNAIWGKNTDINSASIGIELDNNGFEPFSDKQISSLLALLAKLQKKYNIPAANIIGHSDIAPSRKTDPSRFFPWKLLAINGFGIWPDEVLEKAPENFNVEQALRIIGYDTKNLAVAIKAFKLHFIQTEVDDVLDQKTIDTIYNIFSKS